MRVVHVVRSCAFAGTERYVGTVAAGLAARGHDVVAVGGDPVAMAPLVGAAAHVRTADATADVALALLRLGRADVVHAHLTAAELAAALTRPKHRGRLVATRHFAARRGSSAAGRVGAAVVERSLAAEVAISRFVAEAVGRPTTVLLNPVAHEPASPLDEPIVLVAQRLEAEKATATAIRAWVASGLGAEGWRLDLCGDGTERPELEALASDLGVWGSTRFLGQVADLPARRQRASALLAPAPLEPFGLSVAEAMAAGLPVVAADGGAHRETVGAARADLLVPAGDAAAMGRALQRLAADAALRRRAGDDLRAWARRHLSLDAHLDGLESVYAGVVAA